MHKTFKDFLKSKSIETLEGLEAEKVAGLYNEYNDLKRKELEDKIESKATSEEIKALKDDIFESTQKQFDSLNDILKSQGLVLKRISEQEAKNKDKKVVSNLRKHLEENWDKVKTAIKNNDKENLKFSFELDTKVAGDMSITDNVTGEVPQAQREAGINIIATRRNVFLNALNRSPITSNVVSWVYQANKDGAAGPTAEGAAKNQIDFDLLVGSESVEKETAYIKVTDEMLEDIDQMESEIRNELIRELLLDVEDKAYSGTGTAQMRGVRTVATAFAAGAFALAVDNANNVDVLTAALDQIAIAEQPTATAIFMYPSDITALKMVKVTATDKRYVDRLVTVGSNYVLDGVPIIPTTMVTSGQYLVGVMDYATLFQKGGVRIEMGYDSDDFTKNFKTIRAEWRGATRVKHNDRTAFVAGVFATDRAALETA